MRIPGDPGKNDQSPTGMTKKNGECCRGNLREYLQITRKFSHKRSGKKTEEIKTLGEGDMLPLFSRILFFRSVGTIFTHR